MSTQPKIDPGRIVQIEFAKDQAIAARSKADEALTEVRNQRFLLTRQIETVDAERERYGRTRLELVRQRAQLVADRDALKPAQDEAQAVRDAANERAQAAIEVFDNCQRFLRGAR